MLILNTGLIATFGAEVYKPLTPTELSTLEKKLIMMPSTEARALIQMTSDMMGDTEEKTKDIENITQAAERALIKKRNRSSPTHALEETKSRKVIEGILNHLRVLESSSNKTRTTQGYTGIVDADGI